MFTRTLSAAVTILLVALVALSLLASAIPAFARPAAALPLHARLASSTPADGSTVASATEVVLAFSEEVDATFVEVRVDGPTGDEADGSPAVDGSTVTQALVGDLPVGEHTVTYRVVSVDGHPVAGTVAFTTTAAPATASPSASATPAPSTARPTPSPSSGSLPATTPAAATGIPGWVLPAGFAVLVALLAGAGLLATRGRRGPQDGPPDAAG